MMMPGPVEDMFSELGTKGVNFVPISRVQIPGGVNLGASLVGL